MNIIEDPHLALLLAWDAVELSKFDGNKWRVFIDNPFTARWMWDIQVCLFFHIFFVVSFMLLFIISSQCSQIQRANHFVL